MTLSSLSEACIGDICRTAELVSINPKSTEGTAGEVCWGMGGWVSTNRRKKQINLEQPHRGHRKFTPLDKLCRGQTGL